MKKIGAALILIGNILIVCWLSPPLMAGIIWVTCLSLVVFAVLWALETLFG